MIWVIVGCAVLVLIFAGFASIGRLGEMPPPVDSEYPGRIPHPVALDNLNEVVFGNEFNGYSPAEVTQALAAIADGNRIIEDGDVADFSISRWGYRKSQVDQVFAELSKMRNNIPIANQEEMRETHGSDEATDRRRTHGSHQGGA